MKVLNLYAGIGGNRKLWQGCEVTAIESNLDIAEVYSQQNPDDELIIGDAHEYLRVNFADFDFIWSSPPCQTHSKMCKATRHKNRKFPNMAMYEEILFLQHFYKGKWIVENVQPYYDPLITPNNKIGRHLFWCNFDFKANDVKYPGNVAMANKAKLMDWLGIHYDKNIYYDGNHCPAQALRNCVHPEIGLQIFNQVKQ